MENKKIIFKKSALILLFAINALYAQNCITKPIRPQEKIFNLYMQTDYGIINEKFNKMRILPYGFWDAFFISKKDSSQIFQGYDLYEYRGLGITHASYKLNDTCGIEYMNGKPVKQYTFSMDRGQIDDILAPKS